MSQISNIGRVYQFHKPVVFILGAGSSCDLGYPTGRELTNNIIHDFKIPTNSEVLKLIEYIHRTLGVPVDTLRSMIDSVATSSEVTLDYWARRHDQKHAKVARALTAYYIIKAESKTALASKKQPWQQSFLGKFFVNPGDIITNNLHVITFNYDLSFDFFWKMRLVNMGLWDKKKQKRSSKIG